MLHTSRTFGILATAVVVVGAFLTTLYANNPCSNSDRSLVHTAGQGDNGGTVSCIAGETKLTLNGVVEADFNISHPATTCPLSYKYWSNTEYKRGNDGTHAGTNCTTDTDAVTVTEYNSGTCADAIDFKTKEERQKAKDNFTPCKYTTGRDFKEDSASTNSPY